MKKSILLSTLREFKGSISRFISILAIIAIGVGFFAGVKATDPDMRLSANRYYNEQNLMDFRLVSTYGFDKDDIAAIEAIPDAQVYPSYFSDFLITYDSADIVSRVFSLPENMEVNKLILTEGRMPESANECLVDGSTMHINVPVGTEITFKSGTDDDISDTLSRTSYTVVGKFISPMYVSDTSRGTTTLGNGSISLLAYIPQENFIVEYNTEIYITFPELRELSAYSDEYNDKVDALAEILEDTADRREVERFESIIAEAEEEIADAEKELAEGKETQQRELADAQQKLDDAKAELDDALDTLQQAEIDIASGWQELEQNQNDFDAQIANAEKTLEENRSELESASSRYESGLQQYENSLAELATAKEDLEETYAQIQALIAVEGEDSPAVIAALEQYNAAMSSVLETQSILNATKAELDRANSELITGTEQLSAAESELTEQKLSGQQALDDAANTLRQAEQDYMDGLAEYEEGLDEYEDGVKEFNNEKAKSDQEIADAEIEIEDAKNELHDLKKPIWYVFDRNDNTGYTEYGQNAERIDNIAKIFPVFFLLVAALVCLTTMTRMVEEQRTQIGTLKALGYSNGSILFKYMSYALSATLIGALIGLAGGFKLFPSVIIYAYGIMYNIPYSITPFWYGLSIGSIVVSMLCVAITVFFSCYAALLHMPAQLMRPKAPQNGKRVLLERIGFIWNRLNFGQKVSARNIFRYKKRMLMTVVGIAGCTALTLTGFGLRDSISDIVTLQYEHIWNYDAMVAVDDDITERDVTFINETIALAGDGSKLMRTYQKSYTSGQENVNVDITLLVAERTDDFNDFIVTNPRGGNENYPLTSSGAIITEKLAKTLAIEIGDEISLSTEGSEDICIPVTGISENYVMNYVYISSELYESTIGELPVYNVYLCKYADASDAICDNISEKLLTNKNVLQVVLLADNANDFSETLKVLDLVIVVLIISAGALAFVVLYNLTNINITERIREIATLKVLGFNDKEVSDYIFRESMVLTILGSLIGLGLGRLLTKFVVETAEIDMVMFGRSVYFPSYIWSVAITIIFALIVSLVMYRHLMKISMVESLKSVE